MVGVGQGLRVIVCGLVGPGTSLYDNNGGEQLIVWRCF